MLAKTHVHKDEREFFLSEIGKRQSTAHWISVGVCASCISASCYLISNDALQINRWLTVLEH